MSNFINCSHNINNDDAFHTVLEFSKHNENFGIFHDIRMSLSPFYTFKIRISEKICLKGGDKFARITESFELQKLEL